MAFTAAELLQLLQLEEIEQDLFRGTNRDLGTGRIFGGQVLAQALVAARRTVAEDRPAHSLHGYFILAGDLTVPVDYVVSRVRDGGSFTTRGVTANQHRRAIFTMSASFHRAETGPTHQAPMPDVAPPESLRPELDLIRERAADLPERLRAVLTQDRPIDVRPTDGLHPFARHDRRPRRSYWLRALGSVGDDALHHQSILAYASDYGLLGAALGPHGLSYRNPGLMLASLDHAIWFHRPFRMDEWLLYDFESPVAAGARAFTRGNVFTRAGELVASTAQEGLMRLVEVGPTRAG